MTGQVSVLSTCMRKLTWIVASCDPKCYWGRLMWCGKCGVLQFCRMRPTACMSCWLSMWWAICIFCSQSC